MGNNMIETQNKRNTFGFSTNLLKIIAMICMTFDHVGYMMESYFTRVDIVQVAYVFRIIGRITYPLIIFVLIEGLMHTHNIKKYISRLGIGAFVIYLGITLGQVILKENFGYEGNIFLSLFLCAVAYYFMFYSKKRWLVVLPIFAFLISFGFIVLFAYKFYLISDFAIFPFLNGLFCQYSLLTPALFFGILGSYKLYDHLIAKRLKNDDLVIAFKQTPDYQKSKNAVASILIAIIAVICYLITYLSIYEGGFERINDCVLQTYMLISTIFILFYSGKVGYKNKITQYGFYIYYPLHMLLIYLVFWLMFGI